MLGSDRRIIHQLEIAPAAGERTKARAFHQLQEEIALRLEESRQLLQSAPRREEISQAVLDRRNGRERHELVDLPELSGELGRGDGIANLPAGRVIRLSERADHKAARGELRMPRHAFVLEAVEDDVFVHFIADDEEVGPAHESGQLANVRRRQHGAGRIVW